MNASENDQHSSQTDGNQWLQPNLYTQVFNAQLQYSLLLQQFHRLQLLFSNLQAFCQRNTFEKDREINNLKEEVANLKIQLELSNQTSLKLLKTKPLHDDVCSMLDIDYTEITLPLLLDEVSDNVFFPRYLPFIRSDLKAYIDKEIKTTLTKRVKPFSLRKTGVPKENEYFTTFSYQISKHLLPKLDHMFQEEAVLIHLEGSTEADPKFIIGVAIMKPSTKNSKTETIEVKVSSKHSNDLKNLENIKVTVLCGLITYSRIYDFCLNPSMVELAKCFYQGKASPWSENPSEPSDFVSPYLENLNKDQRDAVVSLVSGDQGELWKGLRLLQGPPGTGKTTTSGAILAILADFQYQERSIHRILVATPSHQALKVLAFEFIKKVEGRVAMAWLGKVDDSELTEEVKRVNVEVFTSSMYEPLENILGEKTTLNTSELKKISDQLKKIQDQLTKAIFINPGSSFNHHPVEMSLDIEVRKKANRILDLSEDFESLRQNHSPIENLMLKVKNCIEALKMAEHNFKKYLVQRAIVVFSTLAGSGKKILNSLNVQTVIIDEAGQALVPEIALTLRFSPERMLLIGDHKQLPPCVNSEPAKSRGYDKSLMEILIEEKKQPYKMLTVQYRMHPEISEFSSRMYYMNELTAAPEVVNRHPTFDKNFQNLGNMNLNFPKIFFDVKNGSENRDLQVAENAASISNLEEAKAVANMVELVSLSGINPKDIGVITFYTLQKKIIIDELKKRGCEKGIKVNTVDGFQGGESKIILVSMVRTSKSIGFLNDPKRINVCATRAKEHFWVFGKRDILMECEGSDVREFVGSFDKVLQCN